jgi:transcriptional regulator with XRE-family HTH domain
MLIGQSIKKYRENKNVTQSELAQWLGVSRQAISMWEAEKRELKVNTLRKIAKVFGVSVDQILKTSSNNEPNKEDEMQQPLKPKGSTNEVQFEISAPDAKRVALTGDFKKWSTSGIPMRKMKNGVWKVGIDLQPGRYEYKFIVDNEWRHDPKNSKTSRNALGTLNSVIEIGA